MKRGGGKGKGSAFERKVCNALSLWLTNGKDRDLFWRSSMSGGRATIAARKDKSRNIRASGDICAVSAEGHKLTDHYFIECKHYKDLHLDHFLFGTGKLAAFWKHAVRQATTHGKAPMLIAKQNLFPTLLIVYAGEFPVNRKAIALIGNAAVYDFDAVMASRELAIHVNADHRRPAPVRERTR